MFFFLFLGAFLEMQLWILVKTEDNVKARSQYIIGGPFSVKNTILTWILPLMCWRR